MTRRRKHNDGLPYRVYQSYGVRTYSIGYKSHDGTWAFRLNCPVSARVQIDALRDEATRRALEMSKGRPIANNAEALIDAWLKYQECLPTSDPSRRTESTLVENRREARNLLKGFGHMPVTTINKSDAYFYLDQCRAASRPAKGNKEISLMRTILEYGIRIGMLESNPFDQVEKLKTVYTGRYVTDIELNMAVTVGREIGGPQHIAALCLKTAYLCVRRSVEARALTIEQLTDEGIAWTAAKRQKGRPEQKGLILWSDELKSTIDEALEIRRNKLAGHFYIFGNLSGQQYTKGGWKKTLSLLMNKCVEKATKEGIQFSPFNLQDCRPKGVSDKLQRGDKDVMDATMHTSMRMLGQTYDRRRLKIAKPTK